MNHWLRTALLGLGLTLVACGTAVPEATGKVPMSEVMMTAQEAPDETTPFDEGFDVQAATAEAASRLRAVHLSPDAPAVDVLVDGKVAIPGLEYPNFVGPLKVGAGNRNLKVNAAGTSTTVIDATLPFEDKTRYSVFAVGKLAEIAPLRLQDTRFAARGAAKLRLLHGAPSAPAVDIYVSRPGVALERLEPIVQSLTFKNSTPYLRVRPGKIQIRVTLAGTRTVAVDSGELEVRAGNIFTAAAIDKKGAAGFSAVVIDERKTVEPGGTPPPAPKSIVEIAAGNPEFSTLVAALGAAGLVEALSGKGPFTVFAPTNAAFKKLSALPEGDALKQVLLYHVANGKLTAADLLKAGEVTTLQGAKVRVERKGDAVILNGVVRVTAADLPASNGVIHVLDAVLLPPAPQPPSIVEIATGNPAFSTLVTALKAAGLVEALSGKGPFTVFAPTNDAFAELEKLPEGEALKTVLLYHVAAGRLGSAELAKMGEVTTLQGEKVKVEVKDGQVILNGKVKVTTKDVQASNGVVHVLDAVLIPPALTPKSIVEIAAGDPRFTTLVKALQSAKLVEALSGAGPFTVFAPTNDAFAKLSKLPEGDALKEVLLYHVAGGKFPAAELLKAGEVTTLQGRKVKVERRGGEVILNGSVKVVLADIQASNGVIHVIDAVLIPPLPSILDIATGSPDFSTLVGALQSAGLVGALSGSGPFTVFAPTNAAFAKLSRLPSGDPLKNVLLYHVVSGRVTSAMLKDHGTLRTLLGQNIRVTVRHDGSIVLNDAVRIVTKDIAASNGIVHVIDTVLIPH